MEVKEISKKKMSPLVAIILGAIVFSAGLGLATWYWSQTLTYTMTIEGQIEACTNFRNEDVETATTYAELEVACVAEIFFGGKHLIQVAANGGNTANVYASLELSLPGSTTATATINTLQYIDGSWGSAQVLGPIATDGTQSVQVTHNEEPATWFLESDYPTGKVNILYFMIVINWDPSLPIGEHTVTAIVRLGDSA